MSTPNAEAAYRVLDLIDMNPTHLDMGQWASGLVDLAALTSDPECGTTACFAGWTVASAGYSVDTSGAVWSAPGGAEVGLVEEVAAEILGITEAVADVLFFVSEEGLAAAVAQIFGPRPSVVDMAPINEWDASIDAPAPCQPIGCDNGMHLPGCTYAEVDYGTGCHCGWLGVGTPEHAPSPLCRSLRPDADRDMQPPPCADHEVSKLSCPVCTTQRRAFYTALGSDDPNDDPRPYDGEPGRIEGDTADEQRDNAYARYEADEARYEGDHPDDEINVGAIERSILAARDRATGGDPQ